MADNRQYDSYEIKSLTLPYSPNLGFLSEQPVWTSGQDFYSTWGGTTKNRPGTVAWSGTLTPSIYPVKMLVYQTLEPSPVTWLVASCFNIPAVIYELHYMRLESGTGAWALVTERRGCNHSQHPHEMVVKKGFVWVKGDPLVANDPSQLGSVRLDGTGGTMVTHDWGALGPSVPVAVSAPSGWTASAHNVSVNNSWVYVYTYQLFDGQETNHSPLQTNPDSLPSATGPFTNKIPNMTVQGLADTTEYPFINIYRTTDGGGTFYFNQQIANTGAGAITFNDTFLASGSGNHDPIPDVIISANRVSPTTQSNSPPPTVPIKAGLSTGGSPIQRCTRLVVYAGRIWYAIAQFLFYSALEELNSGVPEDSFPSGLAQPNFFEMPDLVTQLMVTPNGLLVSTNKATYFLNGTTKATFNPRPFLGNIGAAGNFQTRAAIEAGENVAWLTQDYRLAVVNGQSYGILSYPLGDTFKTLASQGFAFDLQFWAVGDKEFLIVGAMNTRTTPTPALGTLYVYDLDRSRKTQSDFWNPPWVIGSSPNNNLGIYQTALCVGQSSTTDTENKLFISSIVDPSPPGTCILAKFDFTAVTDASVTGSTNVFSKLNPSVTSSLLGVPPGDHVNTLRIPGLSPILDNISYERTTFGDAGETDPQAYVFLDDNFTNPIQLQFPPGIPTRREPPLGYKTNIQNDIRTACRRAAIKLNWGSTNYRIELHNLSFAWLPESGANR